MNKCRKNHATQHLHQRKLDAFRSLTNESGIALIVALMLMLVMLTMVPAAMQLTSGEFARTKNFIENRVSLAIAEAGLEHAKVLVQYNTINDILDGPDDDHATTADNGTLTAGGSFFRESASVEAYSGMADILPTVLHRLGMSLPDSMDGRVLYEAMAGSDGATPDTVSEQFETGAGSYRQLLQRQRVDNTVYLDGGWRSR